jgi:hypothetical protein
MLIDKSQVESDAMQKVMKKGRRREEIGEGRQSYTYGTDVGDRKLFIFFRIMTGFNSTFL